MEFEELTELIVELEVDDIADAVKTALGRMERIHLKF